MPAVLEHETAATPGLPAFQRAAVSLTVLVSLGLLMLVLPLGAAGFVTEAFAGASIVFLYNWRDRRDWLAAAGIAALLGAIYFAAHAAVTPWIGWSVSFP